MTFNSVEYISRLGEKYQLIGKEDIKNIINQNLSRLTLGVLDSIFSKQVTIIFSQGNFNLSPLISCIFAYEYKKDALIIKPRNVFNNTYQTEKETYFSLTYKKEVNGVVSNSDFFYKDILWCTGTIGSESNELESINIELYPEHGIRSYRNFHRNEILRMLHKDNCNKMPRIVVIKIDSMFPPSIFEHAKMRFEKEEVELRDFKPKLVIFESINERGYNFENIIKVIEHAKRLNTKLVLHFSWPYLRNIQSFLDQVSKMDYVSLFYFTKNFYNVSKNNDITPPARVRHLSLEGDDWNPYYPVERKVTFKVILPFSESQMKDEKIETLSKWDWHFDHLLFDIRSHLNFESIKKLDRNLLIFPPIFDSLLSPSEIKKPIFINGKWLSVPIADSFSIEKNKSIAVRIFGSMCRDLNEHRNLCYELKDIFTSLKSSKKTLFQAYLMEVIRYQILNLSNLTSCDHIKNQSLIIANLHPFFKTTSSFFENINELISTINDFISSIEIGIIPKNSELLDILINTDEGKFQSTIFENGFIINSTVKRLKRVFNKKMHIKIMIYSDRKSFNLKILTDVNVPYIQINGFKESCREINLKAFEPFVLYSLTINKNGSFVEYKPSKIWFQRSANKSSIIINVSRKTNLNEEIGLESSIDIRYQQLYDIEKIPRDVIKSSKLIIPGFIPFTTVSTNEIIVTQGYNSLLLPFSEIIFFSYPGKNLMDTMRQIELYTDLSLNSNSIIAKRDLSVSLKYTTKKSSRIKYPQMPTIMHEMEFCCESDTPIDSFVRTELINGISNSEEEVKSEIVSLKNIWKSIGTHSLGISHQPSSDFYDREKISFYVKFDNGDSEVISFTMGTIIRKQENDEFVLTSVDSLCEEDRIIYIQREDKETIENYLLKSVLNDENPLEKILEPLTALNLFYNYLNSLVYIINLDTSFLKGLYWLTPEQRKFLLCLMHYIFINGASHNKKEVEQLYIHHPWSKFIELDDLIGIMQKGNNKITYQKLFIIARKMGLKGYSELSFGQLFSMIKRGQTHYYFREDSDLLAIGYLLGHQRIIDDYLLINEEGKKIGTFLQMVSFSIRRVANGQTDPLNEIDILLEDKIKSCTILKICSSHE